MLETGFYRVGRLIVGHSMKNWIRAGFFAIIGGLVIGILTQGIFAAVGDYCGIGAAAWAILFGVPIGSVTGVAVYRNHFLKPFRKSDVVCVVLALLLSGLGGLVSIYAMDRPGPIGLVVVLFGPCLGSLLGYAIGLRVMRRYQLDNRKA